MRVVRTFAFIDLCGFTAYTEEHGDGQAVAILAQLRAALRAAAEHHGVRVTKWLGDGAMLSGVEAPAVIACAVGLREELEPLPLALRSGVCEGAVIMFEGDDYIGAPVNCAARLCDAARGGQLLVEEATAAGIPDDLARRPIPPVVLPGLSREVAAVEVLPRGSLVAGR